MEKWDKSCWLTGVMFLWLGFGLGTFDGITLVDWEFWVLVLPIVLLNTGQRKVLISETLRKVKNGQNN